MFHKRISWAEHGKVSNVRGTAPQLKRFQCLVSNVLGLHSFVEKITFGNL
jgi:hypothetical protein